VAHQDWTDEEVSFLRKYWAEGRSASKIAKDLSEQFGRDLTRNAVITKADRLKLSEESRKEPSAPARIVSREQTVGGEEERSASVKTCRWPFGEPGEPNFSYCGKPVQKRSSFCSQHNEAAYKPKRSSGKKQGTAPDAANRINF